MRFHLVIFDRKTIFGAADPVHPHAEALNLLRVLGHYGTYRTVLSPRAEENIGPFERIQLAHSFDKVFFGVIDEDEALKKALLHFALTPHQALYVSDTEDGIRRGKNAGLFTVGVAEDSEAEDSIKKANPDRTVDSLMKTLCIFLEEKM